MYMMCVYLVLTYAYLNVFFCLVSCTLYTIYIYYLTITISIYLSTYIYSEFDSEQDCRDNHAPHSFHLIRPGCSDGVNVLSCMSKCINCIILVYIVYCVSL